MPRTLTSVLERLRTTATTSERSDEQLLRQFASNNDSAAFSEIVRRHGPNVLAVCRRVLSQYQDAEDAFQATFLVLARKAMSVRSGESLAGWLHGAAYRTAMRARRDDSRRRKHEAHSSPGRSSPADWEVAWREVQAVLDEELVRLPSAYRDAFVLCVLQGLSQAVVARQLRVKEGTVSSRLTRARKLLQDALARRGITLSAVLTALAVTEVGQATVPRALTETAVRLTSTGVSEVPKRVLTLVNGVTRTMFVTKIQIASGLALAAGLLWAGAVVVLQPSSAAQPAPTTPRESGPKDVAGRAGAIVAGRVIDPDGKPAAGAKVAIWAGVKVSSEATTEADGTFRLVLTPGQTLAGSTLVASAAGFGPDWVHVGVGPKPDNVSLKLVKDDVPIQGQIVDLEGKPVANASVRLWNIQRPAGTAGLDPWVEYRKGTNEGSSRRNPTVVSGVKLVPQPEAANLQASPPAAALRSIVPATTDKEGRFRMHGFGRERVVQIEISGAGIATTRLSVITRTGRDDGLPADIHHNSFKHLVGPGKPIVGTIRDRTTRQPIAGVDVFTSLGKSFTDAEGHYRLDGHAKGTDYFVTAGGQSHFRVIRRGTDTPGTDPVTVDFSLERAVVVRGRLTDKGTGKPVPGRVRYVANGDNLSLKDTVYGAVGYAGPTHATAGDDGIFEILTLPGAGWLCALAANTALYIGAEFEGRICNRNLSIRGIPGSVFPAEYHAVIGINIPDKSTTFTAHDIALELGRTVKGKVINPGPGTRVIGLRPVVDDRTVMAKLVEGGLSILPPMKTGEFTVHGLNPRVGRMLVFVDQAKKLGKVVQVPGDADGPIEVRLEPLGSVRGQLLDDKGEPRSGLTVYAQPKLSLRADKDNSRDFYLKFAFALGAEQKPGVELKTDKDGRFRIEGLLSGLKYNLAVLVGETPTFLDEQLAIEPGVEKDLGVFRPNTQKPPAPPAKERP